MISALQVPSIQEHDETEQESDLANRVLLCVTHQARKLSCAVYNDGKDTLYVGEFAESEAEGFVTLQRLKHQLKPENLIVQSSASEALIEAATRPLLGSTQDYSISVLTNISFSVERGKHKLENLKCHDCGIQVGDEITGVGRSF